MYLYTILTIIKKNSMRYTWVVVEVTKGKMGEKEKENRKGRLLRCSVYVLLFCGVVVILV
jgi:hypothetical protein